MDWLQTLDAELFRFINLSLINPVCDVVMPLASGNALFRPLLLLAGILLVWKGQVRGLVCALMLALILPLGDGLICNTIKHAVGRPRPFVVMPEVHHPVNAVKSAGLFASMPSSHAANWFAASMILFIYYRRSAWWMRRGGSL